MSEQALIPSRPFNGWTPDWRLMGLSGLEQVRWGGPTRIDPVGTLLGFRAVEIERGVVTFEMPPCSWGVGYDGEPAPGVLALLADAAHSAAVQTTLPPMRALATIQLTLGFVGPADLDGDGLRCRVRTTCVAEELPVMSSGTIENVTGRVLACTAARCVVSALPGDPPIDIPPSPPPAQLERFPAAAPSRGAPAGVAPPADVRASAPGEELLRRFALDELPAPPLYHLTGLRPTSATPSGVVFTMPASHWLASVTMNIQGGALALLAESAMSAAALTTLAAGEAQRATELSIGYVRPVPADGQRVTARASVVHRRRTLAFGACELIDSEHQAVAVASAVHSLGPSRPSWR